MYQLIVHMPGKGRVQFGYPSRYEVVANVGLMFMEIGLKIEIHAIGA